MLNVTASTQVVLFILYDAFRLSVWRLRKYVATCLVLPPSLRQMSDEWFATRLSGLAVHLRFLGRPLTWRVRRDLKSSTFRSVDSSVGIRTRSGQYVTWDASLAVVRASPDSLRLVRPGGSQRGPRI